MKIYALLSSAALLILGFLFYYNSKRVQLLKRDLADSQQQVAGQEAKLADASSRPMKTSPEMADKMELIRLRAEVSELRREASTVKQLAEIEMANKDNERKTKMPVLAGDEMLKHLTRTNNFVSQHDQEVVAALNQKHRELLEWGKALQLYADANNGNLPTELAEAQRFLPEGFVSTLDLSNFVRADSIPAHLPSLKNPAMNWLFKERVPLILSDGRVCNAYLFADGNVMLFQK